MSEQGRNKNMDLDKAWLYLQGNWTEVDDTAAKFPEESDNLFEMLHYNQTPGTYSVPGEHRVSIYYGPLFPKEKMLRLPILTTLTMLRSRLRE